MTPGIALTNPYFLGNFQMGPISRSVTLHHAREALQGQTLQLIGPIHKLRGIRPLELHSQTLIFWVTFKWAQ